MIHASLQAGALARGIAMDAHHLRTPLEADEAAGIAQLMAAGRQLVAHVWGELRIDMHRPALHDQLEAWGIHPLMRVLLAGHVVNGVGPLVVVYASGDGQPEFQVFAGFNIQFPGKPKVATAPATTSDTTSKTPAPLQTQ